MGAAVPKQFLPLAGRPLLDWTLSAVSSVSDIDGIVLALPPDTEEGLKETYRNFPKVLSVVDGGSQRQDSVCNALLAAPSSAQIILVHDAVRPLASPRLFQEAARLAAQRGAAVPVIPVRDTVKVRGGDDGSVVTRDRKEFMLAQTPQGFNAEIIREAYAIALREGIEGTDDASLVEAAGFPVIAFPGEETNIKITLPEDMRMASGLLEEADLRIGIGADAHRLEEGIPLWLGGVLVDHPKGLLGHSDGDVLLHAVADAVYGALGDWDIGFHFPPGKEETRGMSSRDILAHAYSRMVERGYGLVSLDAVVFCEQPKIAPLAEKLRNSIAGLFFVSADRVSVKGKTTEGMGFEGRGEGISAWAVALLRGARIMNGGKSAV